MPIEILMPALSPTMTEGTLSKWLVKEGDDIVAGDIIAEIETDKATMEIEAVDEGKIGKILVSEGTESVDVNKPIGLLLEEGENLEDIGEIELSHLPPKKSDAKTSEVSPTPSEPVASEKDEASASSDIGMEERILASPLAKRIAANAGIDLSSVSGSGPHGRIIKEDLSRFMSRQDSQLSGATHASTLSSQTVDTSDSRQAFTEVKNSNIRKIIANRLLEAKQTIPHFYLTIDCVIDDLLALRKKINSREGAEYKLSVNDFIIKACAVAMRKVPMVNASWTDDAVRMYEAIDLSVAVATDTGLITPIIRMADRKGLGAISLEMKELVARARENKLAPEEYQGGGFSISNLGMNGIKEFSAIINPPQSAILAVGAGQKQAIVKDGALAVGTVMSCTLSCDHRVVDGAVGAKFLQALKPLIEEPISLLL